MPIKKRKSGSKKKTIEEVRFWELSIGTWDFAYHFGMSPPKYNDDQFSEITTLAVTGTMEWPVEWKGIEVTAYLRGSRGLAAFLDLTFPPQKLQRPGFPSEYDMNHVGLIRPILRTKLPKAVQVDATLPQDMLVAILRSLETGAIRAMHLYSAGETVGDPKAHWLSTVEFQRDLDSAADVDGDENRPA